MSNVSTHHHIHWVVGNASSIKYAEYSVYTLLLFKKLLDSFSVVLIAPLMPFKPILDHLLMLHLLHLEFLEYVAC